MVLSPSRVDVVVATNRTSAHLDAALQSVAEQSYTHWSIVVVDDGSPDPEGLAAVVARHPRARLVRQPAGGVSRARNTGLAAGSAPLVAFLDDDDLWASDKLEAQVAALDRAPAAVGSFTSGWYVDQSGAVLGGWVAQDAPSAEFLRGRLDLPRIVTLLVRRGARALETGFRPDLVLCEDLELTLRLVQEGPLVCVPRPLTGYRRHPDNATSVPVERLRQAGDRMLADLLAAAESQGDRETAALLRENRLRARRRDVEISVGEVAASLRRRDLRTTWTEARWAWGADPRMAAACAGRRAARAVDRRWRAG